jgi:hypothetical protein
MNHEQKQLIKRLIKDALESIYQHTEEEVYRFESLKSPQEIAESIIVEYGNSVGGREG